MSETWLLDSSVFVNFQVLGKLKLLSRCRRSLVISEYVYRLELTGVNAKAETKHAATKFISDGEASIERLTLDDLERLAKISPPRKLGLGELTCAILAERRQAGVLCDDNKAKNWLINKVEVKFWETTEDILVSAAMSHLVSEFDLDAFEETLRRNRFVCRRSLKQEFLIQRLNSHPHR